MLNYLVVFIINRVRVEKFLKEFKTKLNIWGIVFRDDRGKNAQTLLDLEITPNKRKEIISKLEVTDYSQGPIEEILYGGSDMWVFGKKVKKKEVYIKITMGSQNNKTICISFHIAEKQMTYPFKNKQL